MLHALTPPALLVQSIQAFAPSGCNRLQARIESWIGSGFADLEAALPVIVAIKQRSLLMGQCTGPDTM